MTAGNANMLTILFADIAGSTRLYEALGDTRGLQLVTACLALVERATLAVGGCVLKTIGDEAMCSFTDPDQAITAAISMQEITAADPTMMTHRIHLRIGFHHGPVLREEGDVYGDAVNVAARMVQQAKAGQIITNLTTLESVDPGRKANARLVDQTRVKGKQALLTIYEIVWGHPEEMTLMSSATAGMTDGQDALAARMRLQFQNQDILVDGRQPIITIGRDKSNLLIVDDPRVSRLHARIELRRDKFVLVDQSTNGTYILPGDLETVLMRRDEIVLPATGTISLGHPDFLATTMAIRFQRL